MSAKCGFCGNAPCAFFQIVVSDECRREDGLHLGHIARVTSSWGLCTDHCVEIPRRWDGEWALGPFDHFKHLLTKLFREHYAGCEPTHVELRIVRFDSKEGADHLRYLQGKPRMPPMLHPVTVDMFHSMLDFKKAMSAYAPQSFLRRYK